MSKFVALYENFYTKDGKGFAVGGVETYLKNLLPLIKEMGHEAELHQVSDTDFVNDYQGIKVYGHAVDYSTREKRNKNLFREGTKNADPDKDILFFVASNNVQSNSFKRSLTIQHGIGFDTPRHFDFSHERNKRRVLAKSLKAYKTIKDLDKTKLVVCVDYNFVNWYRTFVSYPDTRFHIIPNFTMVPDEIYEKPEKPHIIFARRLMKQRGADVFADIASELLDEFPELEITIAGTGPCKQYIEQKLASSSRVHLTSYESMDAMAMHRDKNIAVVPTMWSEGTSLSVLEAMAAGCAVVSTDIGGLSNIILDGHNGLIVSPDRNEIKAAIVSLLNDAALRKKLAQNGYNTVKTGFNIELWKSSWRKVIDEITS